MKLPKTYEPDKYEPTTYALWESSGSFAPSGKGKPFSVIMPPPNANGNLHIGHALDMNLKDILVRFERMRGRDAVYIPGADHAGFETWVVYEKQLASEGKSRFDFSRDELYRQVWDFTSQKRGDMELQLRALGVSASWDDLVFSLDEKVVSTVNDTFKKLWDDDLIYRGERIVSYCTKHQTSFADIEIAHKEEKDHIWEIAYPLLDSVGEIIVATTRPETLLGDTAIAVHPDDERYAGLVGQRVQVPIVGREIRIVADEVVEKDFGTGAVKVTPAHDPTDFEIGKRHDLEQITVISHDGSMTERAGKEFTGMSSLDARAKVLAALEVDELLRSTKTITHTVGHCYKCDTRIQPLLKDQWFVRVKPLADKAIEALKSDKIAFTPASKKAELITYYEQLRDWNISRQIAWGIPIPAFQNIAKPSQWLYDTRVNQETIAVDGAAYRRDEDTFDTWFSSGQWPFVVTGHLSDGKLSRFFPTDVMETGSDLLRSWIARMIMLSLYRTNEIPFKSVYLHGMVNDEKNQKMSKSKGNVINPMEIIASHGSDALRLGIIANRSAGQNQAFSTASVVAGRNFCNKLWNIARFIEPLIAEQASSTPVPKTIADHWVLSRLNEASESIERHLEQFRFAEAFETMYHVIWNDVADWYLEASKHERNASVLSYVLETCLKLAHPFAPFVTETIWTTLGRSETLLIRTPWPHSAECNDIAAGEFEQLKALITEARYVVTELPGKKQTLLYQNDSLIADNSDLIAHLARLEKVVFAEQPSGLRLAVTNREAWIDIDAETLYEHQSKLELRLADTRQRIDLLEKRLATPSYVENAPHHVVDETKKQLSEQKELFKRLSSELEVL